MFNSKFRMILSRMKINNKNLFKMILRLKNNKIIKILPKKFNKKRKRKINYKIKINIIQKMKTTTMKNREIILMNQKKQKTKL